jgi:hypothetical protein
MIIGSNIRPSKGLNIVKKKNADTNDIIREILEANSERLELQVLEFSKQFSPTYEGLRKLWHWVKDNIYYKEDPDGVQWIREPARLYSDDEGDCKSFTVFITAVLKNLGLNYTIRFVTYDSRSRMVTHVYPIAYLNNGQVVIMDAVWTRFDSQKEPFYLKKDYNFMEISRLSGIGASSAEQNLLNAARHMANVVKDAPLFEMDLTNLSEMQVIRYLTGGNVAGIGTVGGAFVLPVVAVSGIGAGTGKKIIQALSAPAKKALEVIKNASKKMINVIFQKLLPKAAPFFIFCFVKNPKGKVAFAQKKQMNLINWMAKITGTSPAVILASISKGLSAKYKMSPALLIIDFIKGKLKITGIGIIDDVIKIVFSIIKQLITFFKKNDAPAISPADGSDLSLLKTEMTEVKTASTASVIDQNTKENIEKQRELPDNVVGDNTPSTNDGIVKTTLANPGGTPIELPEGEPKTKELKVPALEKDNSNMMMIGGAALLFMVANR